MDIKQQVAQRRGEVIVGDREQFLPQDQVKPCEAGMSLTCSFVRRQALHTVWCRNREESGHLEVKENGKIILR